MENKNIEVCTLYKDENIRFSLNYLGEEIRVYIWDSDERYVDDWSFDIGDNIEGVIKGINNDKKNNFVNTFTECFGKTVICNATIKQWISAKEFYGEENVNRVGDMIIITED